MSLTKSSVFAWIVIAAMAVFLTSIVFAQASDAEITGVIKDPSGAPVVSTVVTLVNQDSGFTRTTNADSDGRYRFVALPPGRYSIKTEATGFKPEIVTGILLNIGTHVDRDLSLSVGSVQEAITVVGDVPPIDTTRSDISGVVTTKQIETLPVNTRQYLNLALLMPGTTQDASRTFYNNVQVGGGDRFYANGFLVDGVTNTWAEQGEPRQNFPEGSVQEFQVKTNQFKAEQGLAMGGLVLVVTKSGTNEFHGDAFEYYRSKFLNRDNKFQQAAEKASGTGKAPFLRNQYGFDAGGPIIRNRLHFYAAFERTQTDSAFTIFTGASGHQFYSANEGVFDQPSHDQMFNLRFDYQISSNQHLFGRWSQEWNLLTFQGCSNASESNCYNGQFPRHATVIGHTWAPTASIVNEARFQYAFSSYQLVPPGAPNWTDIGNFAPQRLASLQTVYNFPSFNYGQGYAELGIEKRWEYKDDITWLKGKHAVKFGFDTSHIPFGDDAPTNYKGTWTFATDQVFNPKDPSTIANLKNPTQYTAAIPPQFTSIPVNQLSLYLQDDWRIFRTLTLNFGLRWDKEFGSYNENLNPNSFSKPIPFLGDPSKRGQDHNFGPRFGFAWDVLGNGHNVVRGGFGIYYNNIQTLLNFPENRNLSQCNVLIKNPSYPDPFGGQSPTAFCSTAPPTVTILDRNFAMPYSEQFSLGYSRELSKNFLVHVDGVYTHTLHDWRNVDLNYPIAGVRPLTAWARILDHQSVSQSKYKAMYVRAEKRYANRYQFLVSYTYSSARDDNPQAGVTTPAFYNLDWGPAGIDRRHALVASGSAELPGKITLGLIWQLRSALPFNALSAVQDADGNRQYVPSTSRNQGNRDLNLAAVNAYRATLSLAPIPASQIDSSRFNSLDVRASRPILTRNEKRIDLIGQVFNVFGVTNLTGGTQTRADSAVFGQILGASNLQQAELAVRIVF
ncbi:MAG: TonB-dependent receptor domain-containing protein [Bryobacteraceae bacterium]